MARLTDAWQDTASDCVQAEKDGKVTIFTIGTKKQTLKSLNSFLQDQPVKLDGLKFKELFLWLSKSASRIKSYTRR